MCLNHAVMFFRWKTFIIYATMLYKKSLILTLQQCFTWTICIINITKILLCCAVYNEDFWFSQYLGFFNYKLWVGVRFQVFMYITTGNPSPGLIITYWRGKLLRKNQAKHKQPWRQLSRINRINLLIYRSIDQCYSTSTLGLSTF